MLKFLRMEIEGFCSIHELSINLDQRQIILVKAPNGYGKSTLFSALVWVLFGKDLKGKSEVQTWKRYRKKDYKGVMVSVFIQHDSSIYQIIRCQKYTGLLSDQSKGNDRLIIYKDAEQLDIKGKIQIQQKIVSIIGLSQQLFINSVMFGQGITRLIKESNTDKKKLFEEVFDLNYLNVAKNIAVEGKSAIISEVKDYNYQLSSLNTELSNTKDTYDELKSKERTFESDMKAELSKLNKKRDELNKKKSSLVNGLGKSKQKDIDSLECKLSKLRLKCEKAKSVSNIPLRDFIGSVYDMILNKKYNQAKDSLLKIKDSFDEIDRLNIKISKVRDEISILKDQNYKYSRDKQLLSNIETDLEELEESINGLNSNKDRKVLSPKYKAKIKELRSKIKSIKKEKSKYDSKIEDYTWVIDDPLGNNGIKTYLFDSSLEFLNKELSRYSDILGFRISFEIDLNSSRKEFVTLIEKDGVIIDYAELSGGEKQLVDVSMALAMNQVLVVSKGINICFLDEIFESLSSDNIELVIQLVREIYVDKTLFIISHHKDLPFSNTKIMEVEKRDGLSYYKGL